MYEKVRDKLYNKGFTAIYSNHSKTEFHFIKDGIRVVFNSTGGTMYLIREITNESFPYALRSVRYDSQRHTDWHKLFENFEFFKNK